LPNNYYIVQLGVNNSRFSVNGSINSYVPVHCFYNLVLNTTNTSTNISRLPLFNGEIKLSSNDNTNMGVNFSDIYSQWINATSNWTYSLYMGGNYVLGLIVDNEIFHVDINSTDDRVNTSLQAFVKDHFNYHDFLSGVIKLTTNNTTNGSGCLSGAVLNVSLIEPDGTVYSFVNTTTNGSGEFNLRDLNYIFNLTGDYILNVTYGGDDFNKACELVKLINIPLMNLSINKTVNDSSPVVGDLVNYSIKVINNGDMTTENLCINDTLPYGLELVDFDNKSGVWSILLSNFVNFLYGLFGFNSTDYVDGIWSLPNLAPGESTSLNITCKVIHAGFINNTANLIDNCTFYNFGNNISTVNLIAGKSDTNLQLNVNNSTFGQSNKIKVNLTNGNGLSNKTINFNINGTNYTSNTNVTTDSDGIAVFNYTPPHAGNYMVSAVFSGDVDYNPSSNSDNFSVFRMDTNLKLNSIGSVAFGGGVGVDATLIGGSGMPNFSVNGTNYDGFGDSSFWSLLLLLVLVILVVCVLFYMIKGR